MPRAWRCLSRTFASVLLQTVSRDQRPDCGYGRITQITGYVLPKASWNQTSAVFARLALR
jgi:hypothetical protein